ncbi:MAG TPA: succinate dehydrogenase hydrophobic membrane anchor subunit [Chloroflexota bacterium]
MSMVQNAYANRPRPQTSFEVYSWFFMRVSGVVLLIMVLGHVAIMHVINSVDTINYWWVAERLATPFWRTYDWIVLVLALLHGMNGMRWVIDDHVHSRGWRTFSMAALWVIAFMFLALGSLVLFTFTPVPRPA